MKLDQINSARFLAADLKRLVTSCSAPTAAAAAAGLRHFNVNILHVIHHQTSKKKLWARGRYTSETRSTQDGSYRKYKCWFMQMSNVVIFFLAPPLKLSRANSINLEGTQPPKKLHKQIKWKIEAYMLLYKLNKIKETEPG